MNSKFNGYIQIVLLAIGLSSVLGSCTWDLNLPPPRVKLRLNTPNSTRQLVIAPTLSLVVTEVRSVWEKDGTVFHTEGSLEGWVLEGLTPGLWHGDFEALSEDGQVLYEARQWWEIVPGQQEILVNLTPLQGLGQYRIEVESQGGSHSAILEILNEQQEIMGRHTLSGTETSEGISTLEGELSAGFYLLELSWNEDPTLAPVLVQRKALWIFPEMTSIGNFLAQWSTLPSQLEGEVNWPRWDLPPSGITPDPLVSWPLHRPPMYSVEIEPQDRSIWYWNGVEAGRGANFTPAPTQAGPTNLELVTWTGSPSRLDVQGFTVNVLETLQMGPLSLWDQLKEKVEGVRGLNGVRTIAKVGEKWITGAQNTAALGIFSRGSKDSLQYEGALTGGTSGALNSVTHVVPLGNDRLVSLGRSQGQVGVWKWSFEHNPPETLWSMEESFQEQGVLGLAPGPDENGTPQLILWTAEQVRLGHLNSGTWSWKEGPALPLADVESAGNWKNWVALARFSGDEVVLWDTETNLTDPPITGINGPVTPDFSPTGKDLYIGGYYDSGIWHYRREESGWTLVSFYGGSEATEAGLKYIKALKLSEDGELLATAGYGWDLVSLWKRNSETGALTFMGHTGTDIQGFPGFDNPRVLAWEGRDLLVGAYDSHTLSIIRVDYP